MKLLKSIMLLSLCAVAGVAWSQPGGNQQAPGSLEQLRTLPAFRGVLNLEALHETAIKGRDQYRLLVNAENFKTLGLDQAADAAKAELGTPSKDYLVRLDQLKEYKSGDDPAKLLTNTGIVHYPLVFDNKTRSTVSIAIQQGEWKVISIGGANRSLKRSLALKESAKQLNKAEDSYFLVRVPALNVEFEAVLDASGQIQLTPIQDYPEWGLKAGIPEPASTVFLRLVPAAKEHTGLPY